MGEPSAVEAAFNSLPFTYAGAYGWLVSSIEIAIATGDLAQLQRDLDTAEAKRRAYIAKQAEQMED